MAKTLTLDVLAKSMRDGAVAVRARTRLQPIGGSGDKVFPPTFGDTTDVVLERGDPPVVYRTRYAVEERRIDGEKVWCVLLDSVASQANRLEEALQRAWDAKRLRFPLVRVDFTREKDHDPRFDLSTLGGDGYLTSLEVPHRLADALLRDSLLDGLRFRASDPGMAFTESSPHDATAVYRLSPNALVFGMWDSTGPKGGQGAKFQRALVSEIIGVGMVPGRKTASRLDPAGIELKAGPVYIAADPDQDWTIHEDEAETDSKGKPQLYSRRGGDKAGKPSSINHGNVTPSVESEAGGVTLEYGLQTTTLSLPALRRLRFPRNISGDPVPLDERETSEQAARTALAALALSAVAFQRDEGYDLRSRCAFVPEGPLALEVVGRAGDIDGPYSLDPEAAATLLHDAVDAAGAAGMGWSPDAIDLVPAPKLVELIRESRKVAARASDGDEG